MFLWYHCTCGFLNDKMGASKHINRLTQTERSEERNEEKPGRGESTIVFGTGGCTIEGNSVLSLMLALSMLQAC